MRMKLLGVLALVVSLGVLVVAAAGNAIAAKPAKYAVCHYGSAGGPSTPKTLWLGSPKAVAQHVAHHTVANGHLGNDYAGVCQ